MHKEQLSIIGLSDDQITVYEALLKVGAAQAGRISLLTNLKRPHVYKILDRLIELEIVTKDDTTKVSKYIPNHPTKLISLIEKKRKEIDSAEKSLNSSIDEMISNYNFVSQKPNVQFFEGSKGLVKLYDDINTSKEDIHLFRSPYDQKNKSLESIITKQIHKQVELGIKTFAITPLNEGNREKAPKFDPDRMVERRIIPEVEFKIPAQIVIYKNKVGITSYKKGVFTTIIDNADISDTFKKIFDQLWIRSENPLPNSKNYEDKLKNS